MRIYLAVAFIYVHHDKNYLFKKKSKMRASNIRAPQNSHCAK